MRSILKHPQISDLYCHQQCPEPFPFATSSTVNVSPHVHFPPTPTLTSTFITHSSTVYDRTPAAVLPNTCALPGRHEREIIEPSCPRRTRHLWNWDAEGPQGSYFHPRGSASESSESDDSDVLQTPPEPSLEPPIAVRFGCRNTSNPMSPYSPSEEEIQSALFFLPHAPVTPLTRKGTRGSPSLGRRETADGRIQRRNDFAVPTLDFEGCLGGF
ncbi:hypothetical protein JVU11DRAFT_4607 [Chiua virens]|nr:hypothetical protein JVU11DRAFT_11256 [Chiua virens]KAG9313842.1 hypothetical protein JVU11DRAFT_4607 [Chiua virens]